MRLQVLTVCAFTLLLLGCGGGDDFEQVDVYGTAKYMGQPIEDGAVQFVPKAGATSDKPARAAQIVNGSYSASDRGGVPPGEYTIKVEAYRKNRAASGDPAQEGGDIPEAMIVRDQVLPEKHNKNSERTLNVESGSGSIEYNIDLEE